MLMRLSPKANILFVHVTTKLESYPVTEKMNSKKSGWSSIRWLMYYPSPGVGEPIYYQGPHEFCIIAGGPQNQLNSAFI